MSEVRADSANSALVYVVDDDGDLGNAVTRLLRRQGYVAEPFLDPAVLIETYSSEQAHCIITDVMMGDMDGFVFAENIRKMDPAAAIIFMTAWPTTANAVDAVRRYGGLDYLEKPLDEERLLASVKEGVRWSIRQREVAARTARLTRREREVLDLLVKGQSNKMIAASLGLSPKTIENHRASIMAKTGAGGLAQLIALISESLAKP
jgi:two-component system CheB/CheR fusion protein